MAKHDYGDRDPLTGRIIGVCYQIHSQLGPGFVEKIYVNALKRGLDKLELKYEEEKEFSVSFDGEHIGTFRADLVIEGRVIVEVKAVTGRIPKIFESQLISYLKASGLSVGLLVNFGNARCEVRRLMT